MQCLLENSWSKKSLRFKIRNELQDADYHRLANFLQDFQSVSAELFPGVDLNLVSISPVTIAVEGFGYKLDAETSFAQPIGFGVYDELKLGEVRTHIAVNRGNLKISKIVAEQGDLENDLNMILKIVERIVNHVCIRFDRLVEQAFTINSEELDKQLNMLLEREELEKRGETPRPFGTLHAKSSSEAKERAGSLIPLYKERDKAYLYAAKKVYSLLPHDFVTILLRCDDATMVREEEFDKRGKNVLRDLVYRKRLKKHETMDGIVCYYDLDEKTRRYLAKYLERGTSRR
jgi:hypothetical protein